MIGIPTDGGIVTSMQNTYSLFRSKTFYTIIVMFLIGGFQGITSFLPSGSETIILGALGLLASYFHLDTAKTGGVTN